MQTSLELKPAYCALEVHLLDGSTTSFEFEVRADVRSMIYDISEGFGIEGDSLTYGLLRHDADGGTAWIAEHQTLYELMAGQKSFSATFCKRFLNPWDPAPEDDFDLAQTFLRCLSDFRIGRFAGQLSTNDLRTVHSLLGDPSPAQALSPRGSQPTKTALKHSATDFKKQETLFSAREFVMLVSKAASFGTFSYPAEYFRPSDASDFPFECLGHLSRRAKVSNTTS
jgi:hypothetical protein